MALKIKDFVESIIEINVSVLRDNFRKEYPDLSEEEIDELILKFVEGGKAREKRYSGKTRLSMDPVSKSLLSADTKGMNILLNRAKDTNALLQIKNAADKELTKAGLNSFDIWVDRAINSVFLKNEQADSGITAAMIYKEMMCDNEAVLKANAEEEIHESLLKLSDTWVSVTIKEQDGSYSVLDDFPDSTEIKEGQRSGHNVKKLHAKELDFVILEENKKGHTVKTYKLVRPAASYYFFASKTNQYSEVSYNWFHPLNDDVKRISSKEGLLRERAILKITNIIDMHKNGKSINKIEYEPILKEIGCNPDYGSDKSAKVDFYKWKKKLREFIQVWAADRIDEGLLFSIEEESDGIRLIFPKEQIQDKSTTSKKQINKKV